MTGIVNSTGARSGVIGTTVGTPSGGILQVVVHNWNDHAQTTGTTYSVPTGGSCAITPLDINSHFYVVLRCMVSSTSGSPAIKIAGIATTTTTTAVSPVGASSASHTLATMGGHETSGKDSAYCARSYSCAILHDPALSNLNEIYYNMIYANFNSTNAVVMNRAANYGETNAYMINSTSSITVMEVTT